MIDFKKSFLRISLFFYLLVICSHKNCSFSNVFLDGFVACFRVCVYVSDYMPRRVTARISTNDVGHNLNILG